MKKANMFIAGFALLALGAFQSCQNCDEAVAAATKEFQTKLTGVQDSLNREWQKEAATLRAQYDSIVQLKNDQLAQ